MRRHAVLLLSPILCAALVSSCGGGKTAAEEAQDKGLPTVSGAYGAKPKVKSDPDVKPGKKTKFDVLVKGKGPKVAKGDLLVADYLGQIYATNKVFDNSYDRGQPSGFQIGAGKVIVGWDKALVGVNAGSRVVMVVPPSEGYGAEGNAQAGIKGTDSLVFVVDVIASYGKGGLTKAPSPVLGLAAGLPKVSGEYDERPTITVPKGTTPPKKPQATVLGQGSGPALEANKLTVVHFVAVSWANQEVAASWDAGVPQAVPLGAKDQPSPFDILAGVPVGSRVLVLLPPQEGGKPKTESLAVVVDVIAQNGPAKEKAK